MYIYLNRRLIMTIFVILSLGLIVACGGAAEEETDSAPTAAPQATAAPQQAATAAPAATSAPAATAAPTAVPPTTAPARDAPTGTLNIGFKELGPYSHSNRLTESTVWLYVGTASHESLLRITPEGEKVGKLGNSWAVDETGTLWTFTLNKGVQFHKGWGEVTVDDYIFAANDHVADGSISSLLGTAKRIFHNPEGGMTKIDDYTFEVDTVTPQFDMLSFGTATPTVNIVVSKKHFEEKGEEVAMFEGVGTGAWEYVGSSTGEVWRFKAVEGHYRKTPEFAELMMWEIPEEATRVANFQAGKLDSFQMALDSKAAVDQTEDIRYMSVPNGATEHLGFYGNWYAGHGEPDHAERRPGYDPELPWVSPNPDVNSPAWERARKVREALSIAIDRDLIVETLLGGEGAAQSLWFWENQIRNLDEDLRTIPFDPERAKQLLEEAGYPDGFPITLTPSIRGVPAEVEACEAISEMWEEIGIDTTIQRVPYLSIGPQIQARTYNQASCHGTDGRLDPLDLYPPAFGSESGWTAGFDHPIMDELIEEALVQIDDEGHFRAMNEAARFVYENVLETGLYSVNILWPLGPKVESWADDLEYGATRAFGAYEWARHRNQ